MIDWVLGKYSSLLMCQFRYRYNVLHLYDRVVSLQLRVLLRIQSVVLHILHIEELFLPVLMRA